jgi:hypothetical protein
MGYVRSGVHPQLEAEADRLIRESLEGVTSQAAKSDILTPWKEQNRRSREVYPASGSPDSSIRQGMYHREINRTLPHLNSVDGVPGGGKRNTAVDYTKGKASGLDPWDPA